MTGVGAKELREIQALVGSVPAPRPARVRQKPWNHLGTAARSDIVASYQAGETSTALAAQHGVVKSTILSILRANGVAMRRQSLSSEVVAEAARLYRSGLSLSRVAAQLEVNQQTMRVAIIKTGVTLRDPTGGRREQIDDRNGVAA